MKKPKKLTTTSYAILAHLAVQPWSAFELARQMTRGLDLIWPRAESAIYEEPKNLVAHGLARAVQEPGAKGRTRSVYAITPAGRAALRRWLSKESAAPQFESEAMLRVFFAEHSSKKDLLATLDGYAAFGAGLRARLQRQIEGYLRDRGPFPERWHVISLGARFLADYALLCERWARWAATEVRDWPSVHGDTAPRGEELFREILARPKSDE